MLHYAPQHVSSSTLLILRKTNCITTASRIVTLCKQPYSMQVESGLPAYFVTPNGCVIFIQFYFDVLILIYPFCLFYIA